MTHVKEFRDNESIPVNVWEKKLTDGSLVYEVEIGDIAYEQILFPCTSKEDALSRAKLINDIVSGSTIIDNGKFFGVRQ